MIGLAILVVFFSGTASSRPPGPPADEVPVAAAYSRVEAPACPVCHGKRDIVEELPGARGEALYVRDATIARSVHAELECTACHPTPSAVLHGDITAEKAAARASCAGCHKDEARQYGPSIHGPTTKLAVAGSTSEAASRGDDSKPGARPDCVTCHGTHTVTATDSPGSRADAAAACSGCHTERGKSFFERDYHGKQARLGRTDVADCADCHNGHGVFRASDGRSSVSEANALATCQKCHASATKNFADISIHIGGTPFPSDPKLRAATLYMMIILVGTFGFFGTHTALAIRHTWRRQHPAPAVAPEKDSSR